MLGWVTDGDLSGVQGHMIPGTTGGFWHWADETEGYKNTELWLKRGHWNYNSSARGINPQLIVNNPLGAADRNWTWVMSFLVSSLLAPNKNLTNIPLGSYKLR